MDRFARFKWYRQFASALLLFAVPLSVLVGGGRVGAFAYSQLGITNYLVNYGSQALITTTYPTVPYPQASFEFVNSYVYAGSTQRFVQTGTARAPQCGSQDTTYVYTEWTADDANFHPVCSDQALSGIYSYFQQTNSQGYWCSGWSNNPCIQSAANTDVGMGQADYVVVDGETSDPSADMGGISTDPAVIQDVTYKATADGGIDQGVYSYGEYYGSCAANPCPYMWIDGVGGSYGTLYTENWTSR